MLLAALVTVGQMPPYGYFAGALPDVFV